MIQNPFLKGHKPGSKFQIHPLNPIANPKVACANQEGSETSEISYHPHSEIIWTEHESCEKFEVDKLQTGSNK